MDCIQPGAVSDDDLLALGCGEVREIAARHVVACPACAAAVSSFAATNRHLAVKMARLDCPSALTLGELTLQVLEPDQALAVRAHLADCPHCAAEYSSLATVLRGDPLAGQTAAPGFLRRVLASLAPASRGTTLLAGVRGDAGSGPRRFQAEELTVSLVDQALAEGSQRSWTLLGLIDPAGPELEQRIDVTLARAGEPIRSARVDELGNFILDQLPAGTYVLELWFPDRVIVMESVTVGDAADGK